MGNNKSHYGRKSDIGLEPTILTGEVMKNLYHSYIILLVYFVSVYSLFQLLGNMKLTYSLSIGLLLIFLPIYLFMILLLPLLQKQKKEWLIGLGCCLYAGFKVGLYSGSMELRWMIISSIIEMIILGVGTWMAIRVVSYSNQLQKSIDHVILPKLGHRIYNDIAMAKRIVEHEFIRSRRYNHPITTIVVEPGSDDFEGEEIIEEAINEIRESLKAKYVAQKLAQIIEEETRTTDIVIELNEEGQLIIVCPETTAQDSQGLIERLQTAISKQMGIPINYGVASFPTDAPTFEAVLEKAQTQVMKKPNYVLEVKPSIT